MDATPEETEPPAYKLYSIGEIGVCSYIGGPLAGCYLMSVNFKSLNNEEFAKNSLRIGITSSALIFAGILMVPENMMNMIPNFLIPLIYTSVITGYSQKLQGIPIKEHIEKGGKKYSGWKVFGLGILFLILTLVYSFALAMLLPIYN